MEIKTSREIYLSEDVSESIGNKKKWINLYKHSLINPTKVGSFSKKPFCMYCLKELKQVADYSFVVNCDCYGKLKKKVRISIG